MLAPDCYMIDRRILLEARAFIDAGNKVTLLSGFECQKEEQYIQEGIDIHRYKYDWDDERLKKIRTMLPKNDYFRTFINKSYMYLARRFFEVSPFDQFMINKALDFDADIYHVHDLPCLKAGYYAARFRSVPLVYDAHELYYAQSVLPLNLQKLYFRMEKKYIKYPDVTITVNPFIAGLMAERYKVKQPEVIMNCTESLIEIDSEEAKKKLRKKGNIPESYKIVLYQGWISQERNIETLIQGVKYFPNEACLAIIGYGEHENVLRILAKKENVGEKVFFLGAVPSDEILSLTAGADLGVIPYLPIDDNHKYCSPNKFFEFILAGVPVITGDLPFFRLMNEKYDIIKFVDISNSEMFGKLVTKLFSEPLLLDNLKTNCYKAGKELNWEVERKKLLNIYNQSVLNIARQ
ncbi:MAG TPA: hypothetical protein DCK76_09060 [Desulfotomaculum sp.]|nr:hypothetical protein [Desulfotomaculum sp.]HBY04682.1 hypothetical protein [Desulfotomaculum sp.]